MSRCSASTAALCPLGLLASAVSSVRSMLAPADALLDSSIRNVSDAFLVEAKWDRHLFRESVESKGN